MSRITMKEISKLKVEIIDGDRGENYPKKSELTNSGYCLFLNTSNVTPTGFMLKDVEFITKEKDESLRNGKLKRNDVVMTTRGTVGNLGLYNEEIPFKNVRINSGMVIFRCDSTQILPEYLFIVLQSWIIKKQILLFSSGSVQKQLPISVINRIKIPYVQIDKQMEIVKRIQILDKKISINRKLISELDEYSQLLFHKWFMEFNFPNENEKPYKDNGGIMQIVNGKTVPLGWDYVELPKLCAIVDCLHSKKPDRVEEENGNILLQLFNIKDHGLIDTTKKYYVSDDDYKLWTSRIEVKEGDLVITNAGRVASIAQIPEGFKFGIGRNMTAIRPEKITPTFLYLYFHSSDIKTQIKKNTDQGSFFESLNVRGIKQLKIIKPQEKLMKRFEEKSRLIRKKIELLNIENQNLTEMRDLLIKKLI